MDTYKYTYQFDKALPINQIIEVGVAGSGNLEVVVAPNSDRSKTEFIVRTNVPGYKPSWDAVIEQFCTNYPFAGLRYTLNDAGAPPPVVHLRLRQAIEVCQQGYREKRNYLEARARNRIYSLVDEGSFQEFLGGQDSESPNLPALNIQTSADDGIVIGTAMLNAYRIAIAAQEKDFIGGSVGEVHGAKLNGLIKYAIRHQLDAIILLIDSGGVRLHEANVGEIEISEIIRSILDAQSAGIKTIGVICGNNGAYGGMGILSGTLNYLIVNQVARIGVSGAEVIEAVKGKEVFDSNDRSLVWRVYGGRTRFMQKAVQEYTTNQIPDIRRAVMKAIEALNKKELITLEQVLTEHETLCKRIKETRQCTEAGEWLAHHKPELFKKNVFNATDSQFLTWISSGEGNE